jgi:hypothetical protein
MPVDDPRTCRIPIPEYRLGIFGSLCQSSGMTSVPHSRWTLRRALMGLACALMLIGRVAAPILPMPAMAQAMLTAAGICHSDNGGPAGGDQAPGHHVQSWQCS